MTSQSTHYIPTKTAIFTMFPQGQHCLPTFLYISQHTTQTAIFTLFPQGQHCLPTFLYIMTSQSTHYTDSNLHSVSTRPTLSPHIPIYQSTHYTDSNLHSVSTRPTLSPHIPIYNDISVNTLHRQQSSLCFHKANTVSPHSYMQWHLSQNNTKTAVFTLFPQGQHCLPTFLYIMTSQSTHYKDSNLHYVSTRPTLSPHIPIYNNISFSVNTIQRQQSSLCFHKANTVSPHSYI